MNSGVTNNRMHAMYGSHIPGESMSVAVVGYVRRSSQNIQVSANEYLLLWNRDTCILSLSSDKIQCYYCLSQFELLLNAGNLL